MATILTRNGLHWRCGNAVGQKRLRRRRVRARQGRFASIRKSRGGTGNGPGIRRGTVLRVHVVRLSPISTKTNILEQPIDRAPRLTPPAPDGQAVGCDVTLKDRIEAGYWLADRGYGKAPITVNVAEDEPENPFASYNMEELLAAHRAMIAIKQESSDSTE